MFSSLPEDSGLPSESIRWVEEIVGMCVNCSLWRVGLPLNISVSIRQWKTFGAKVIVVWDVFNSESFSDLLIHFVSASPFSSQRK